MASNWKLVKYDHYILMSGGELASSDAVIAKAEELSKLELDTNLEVLQCNTIGKSYYAICDSRAPEDVPIRLKDWINNEDNAGAYYESAPDNESLLSRMLRGYNKLGKRFHVMRSLIWIWVVVVSLATLVAVVLDSSVFVIFLLMLMSALVSGFSYHMNNLIDLFGNKMTCIPAQVRSGEKTFKSSIYVIDTDSSCIADTEKLAKKIRRRLRRHGVRNTDWKLTGYSDGRILMIVHDKLSKPVDGAPDEAEVLNHLSDKPIGDITSIRKLDRLADAEMVIDSNSKKVDDNKLYELKNSITNLESKVLGSNTISAVVSKQISDYESLKITGGLKPADYQGLVDKLTKIESTLDSISENNANMDSVLMDLQELSKVRKKLK